MWQTGGRLDQEVRRLDNAYFDTRRPGHLLADLPPEQVPGPVEAEITKTLAKEHDDATQRLNAAMRTRRTQHLVQLLGAWKTAPAFTDMAARQGKKAVKYVEQARRS